MFSNFDEQFIRTLCCHFMKTEQNYAMSFVTHIQHSQYGVWLPLAAITARHLLGMEAIRSRMA